MGLEDLKTNLELWNTLDFRDDFVWGISYGEESKIKDENDNTFLLESSHNSTTNDASFFENELKKYKQEIDLLIGSRILYFKFSLSWSRIIPDGIGIMNSKAIDFYHQVLDLCKENGVEPFVTLYDSCLPKALRDEGGWSNRESLNWFENYVTLCAYVFKEKVTYWIIFNEPSVFIGASNFFEVYPSGKNKINLFLSALHHSLLGQSIGFNKIKEIIPNSQLGTFLSCKYCIALTHSEKDIQATERMDAFLNRIFIEPALGMGYPTKSLPFLKRISKYSLAGDDELLAVDFDFIGLQNCGSEIVSYDQFVPYLNAKIIDYNQLRVKKKYLNLENYNELMYHVIKKYSTYADIKKILISENINSSADQNDLNSFLTIKNTHIKQTFLQELLLANQNGGKVNGYFISTR